MNKENENTSHVILYPNEMLRSQCVDVSKEEFGSDEFGKFLDYMGHIVVSHRAVGLAAPQVGVNKNILVFAGQIFSNEENKIFALANPKIIVKSDKLISSNEGCLSFPGITVKRRRHESVTVNFSDTDGAERTQQFSGFAGIVIQHEIDHLNGKLHVDGLSKEKKKQVTRKFKKLIKETYPA